MRRGVGCVQGARLRLGSGVARVRSRRAPLESADRAWHHDRELTLPVSGQRIRGSLPEGYPSGQREQTVNLPAYAFEGSNPSPSTTFLVFGFNDFGSNDHSSIQSGEHSRSSRGVQAKTVSGSPAQAGVRRV